MFKTKYIVIFIFPIVLFNCKTKSKKQEKLITNTINIKTTAKQLTLFAEHVISTPLYERDMAISPQGNELIYTLGDYKQNRRCLVYLSQNSDEWTEPQILNISGKYQDIEPFYSNNGNRLYFASNRPIYNDTLRTDYNIWYSDRINNKWSNPVALDSIINTKNDEFYPSLSNNGNLYFTATKASGVGREDIFISEFKENKFQSPKPLPTEINTTAFEFNAYINPEENILIFSSFGRADGFGGGDLYISRKDSLGKWTASKNLGKTINSDKLDYCPFVDWNSRNFYFTSERKPINDKKIESVEELKSLSNSPLNSYGNIYKIGFDQLE
ncbi:WD40 repeat protein [Lacinutrix venerupis]|uniref:sialidase family protein n=1 Tax=Lacinutrix venerupis TaxID=1486034 RepID=UPI000EB16758|nr:sialidase family protein [Lacinutrix venerupis]RLJ61966.1 WD40 repeat protein [Lacinutrix venerupis]